MIHVVKNFDAPPAALTRQEIKDSLSLILNGDKKAISSDLYRGRVETPQGVKFLVVEALMKLYYDKCAYCECKEFSPQIEHYRPKNRVTGARGHKGYYWLVYEWVNLVPTCFDCNKVGTAKGNYFPIKDEKKRLAKPHDNAISVKDLIELLIAEQPMLLHPEIDTHAPTCFAFSNKGKMKGVDKEGRGKATIKICNLNRRNLIFRRQKYFDEYLWRIKDALDLFRRNIINNDVLLQFLKITFLRMEKWNSPNQEYSLFGKYAIENFSKIALPLLPKEYRATVKEAHQRFITGTL